MSESPRKLKIQPLLEAQSEITHSQTAPTPIILSSRVRLARNLSQFPFPGRAKEAQRNDVYELLREAISNQEVMQQPHAFNISELNDLEKQILVERHLVSRELTQERPGSGVLISRDQSLSIMINEEDHLRLQILRGGFHFKRIWKNIDALDTKLEEELELAFSPELGYLTACPTNVGTGMRASVMMHLPGLVISGQMEKVVRAVNQLGIAVRGLFGEGSDASGSIFQISNQQTLGESEADIFKRLTGVLNTIIEQEENARQKLIEDDPEKLFDKIGRAFGTLQHGHVLSSAEAMNCLSLMRLGVDLHLLGDDVRASVDRLFIECQPGHVQYAVNEDITTEQRDVCRAKILRECFQEIPPLNFDNLETS